MITSLISFTAIAQVETSNALPVVEKVPASQILLWFAVGAAILLALTAYFRTLGGPDEAKPAPAAVAPKAAAPVVASVDAHLVVVLAAAAYAVLGQNVRVVSIQPASGEWSAQGRRDIFTSHQIR